MPSNEDTHRAAAESPRLWLLEMTMDWFEKVPPHSKTCPTHAEVVVACRGIEPVMTIGACFEAIVGPELGPRMFALLLDYLDGARWVDVIRTVFQEAQK
jgi:hypothetical protein